MNIQQDKKGGGPIGSSPEPATIQNTIKKKCYEMAGYIEYIAQINTSFGSVLAHFKGGSMTGYGSSPARLITANPVVQKIIENSDLFKAGRIRVHKI